MSNKKRNKEIRNKFELQAKMKDYPESCFCYEALGEFPDVDTSKPIGQTEPVDGFPHPHSKGYSQEIYICKRCNKKSVIPIVYA